MESDLALALLLPDETNINGDHATRRYESEDNSLISENMNQTYNVKIDQKNEIHIKMNESKRNPQAKNYITFSPFPVLDLLIFYTGTWSYRQHKKYSNYIASIIIFCLLWTVMILDVIGIFQYSNSYRFSFEIVTVICLYTRTIFRLYYFSRFTSIWMRKNSYFQNYKKNQEIYKTNLKISRFIVRSMIFTVSIIFITKHIYKYYIDTSYKDSLTKYLYQCTYPLLIWFKDIPICLMSSCCYLTCIECCFLINEYKHDLLLSFKFGDSSTWITKWKNMRNEIKTRTSGIQYWTLSASIYIIISLWIFVEEFFLFPNQENVNKTILKILEEIAELWMVGLTIYSACLVTKSFEELKINTNELIANYTDDNKSFDKLILRDTMDNNNNNNNNNNVVNIKDELLICFRRQQNIVELLRLTQLMNTKPCHFTMMGLKISFKGVAQGIILFSIARFVNYIWDDFLQSDLHSA